MLSLYPLRMITTEKLWEDLEKLPVALELTAYYHRKRDILAFPSIALGTMNKLPYHGFPVDHDHGIHQSEIWFYAVHTNWLLNQSFLITKELFARNEQPSVFKNEWAEKFSPGVLLYGKNNPLTVKQLCQSYLLDKGKSCQIDSAYHLKEVFNEMSKLDYSKNY